MDAHDQITDLPPLEWLRVFEAAARLRTFTAAAADVGLTQAAVSQRIRHLEARLGVFLFDRLPRGVELTADGEAYAPHVRAALTALQRSTHDLFGAHRSSLTIAGSASVIQLWVAPRIGALKAASPAATLSLATVHRDADFAAAQADFEIRFGEGDWRGRSGVSLYGETLAPVAAPALVRASESRWRDAPQIGVVGPRHGWLDWAAKAAVLPPPPSTLRFDSFVQARSAALRGDGVLLGSLALLEDDLATGMLIRLPAPSVTMSSGYWLIWSTAGTRFMDHTGVVNALTSARDRGMSKGLA